MSENGHPWDQLQGEPDDAYRAFLIYRDMPWRSLGLEGKRSLVRVTVELAKQQESHRKATKRLRIVRPVKHASGQITKWSRAWRWVSRSHAYDVHMRWIHQQAREQAIVESEKQKVTDWDEFWKEQRQEFREMADLVNAKIRKMLEFPISQVKEKVQDGPDGSQIVQLVFPAKWTFNSVVNLMRAMAEYYGLAAEKPIAFKHITREERDQHSETAQLLSRAIAASAKRKHGSGSSDSG